MSKNNLVYGENNSTRVHEAEIKITDDYEEIEENEIDISVDAFSQMMNLEVFYKGNERSMHFCTLNISRPGLQLVGFYEHFAPERIQVIGEMETTYLEHMSKEERKKACDKFLSYPVPCVVFSTGITPCEELMAAAQKYDRVLLGSKLRSTVIMNELSLYLNAVLAPMQTVHGVLMDIYGVGVLIIGDSGVGKSETALELVQRGHRLVADDAVVIHRINAQLEGTSPAVIRYFMEVRGIGIIDVRAMYGTGSVQLVKNIELVVKLEPWNDTREYDRLGNKRETHTILGVKRPMLTVPIRPGRNLAIILEAAARNQRLNDMGTNTLDELNARLKMGRK